MTSGRENERRAYGFITDEKRRGSGELGMTHMRSSKTFNKAVYTAA